MEHILKHIFISHATEDDGFVKTLRENMELHKLTTWVDSRNMRGGFLHKSEIKKAIEEAAAFILVVSPETFNSRWIKNEVKQALKVKKKRSNNFSVIPLLLDDTNINTLDWIFKKKSLAIKVDSSPGGIDKAMPDLLAALGLSLPNDSIPDLELDNKPVEDLTLILTDPFLKTIDKVTRAAALAKLVYKSASGGPDVESMRFTFISPVGPIENEDLRWYLEEYFRWPSGVFRNRAKEIEKKLPKWGHDLYKAFAQNEGMIQNWKNSGTEADLRFTVFVDPSAFDPKLSDEEAQQRQAEADEASTLVLGLPWELLHDGRGYLFKGARPVFVRRGLPNRIKLDVVITELPVRVLLVSPRPEEEGVSYIDHRVSALPLVEAMENLGDMVQLTILNPPTFKAMDEELTRARSKKTPYHVVHFDGHGVFDKRKGLGALCFEKPEQNNKLEQRETDIIDAQELAETIQDHRIPLFFLEACQSAQADKDPTASVATRLLDQGVASVIC